MSSINSGISIYPSGYDLNVSGSTMTYVSDEVRDIYTGNVVSSGDFIVGVHVNTAYTALDKIERILGLNPQSSYNTVSDRMQAIESISGSSAFVKRTGDTITGNIDFISGASISIQNVSSPSGINWTGDGAFIFNNAGTIDVSGQSFQLRASIPVIDFDQQLNIRYSNGPTKVLTVSSGNVAFYQNISASGSINVGDALNPINTLYVSNIVGGGVVNPSGEFLPLSGGVISGNTTLSGASLFTAQSGTGSIGELINPFDTIYSKNGYFTNISGMSPISIQSEIVVSSGLNPLSSGTQGLGSSDFPFGQIYVSQIYTDSVTTSGSVIDFNTLVQTSGSTMTGDLVLSSGADISNAISGVNNLGSQDNPFANIWTDGVNGNISVRFQFNEALGYVSPSGWTFANSPSGAVVCDLATVAGVTNVARYLIPSTHYTISGVDLTLSPGVIASGLLYSPFYIY